MCHNESALVATLGPNGYTVAQLREGKPMNRFWHDKQYRKDVWEATWWLLKEDR